MKKIVSIILFIAFAIFGCGCTPADDNDIYPPDSYDSAELSSVEESESDIVSSDESSVNVEEIYEFLLSEYVVTSTRESFGTVYVCQYYFVDGVVKGAKLSTTLSDVSSAEAYYEIIAEDYPDSTLDGTTIVHYIEDDEHIYYGYKLDKLIFMLEKTGYEVEYNFDKEAFDNEFYISSTP